MSAQPPPSDPNPLDELKAGLADKEPLLQNNRPRYVFPWFDKWLLLIPAALVIGLLLIAWVSCRPTATAPQNISLQSAITGNTVTAGEPIQLTGSAPPGAEVQLYNQGELVATTTADANGNYQFSFTPTQPGEYKLETVTTVNGQRVTSSPLVFTVTGVAVNATTSAAITPVATTVATAAALLGTPPSGATAAATTGAETAVVTSTVNETAAATTAANETVAATTTANETPGATAAANETAGATAVVNETVVSTSVADETVEVTAAANETAVATTAVGVTAAATSVSDETEVTAAANETAGATSVANETVAATTAANETPAATPSTNETVVATAAANETAVATAAANETSVLTPVVTESMVLQTSMTGTTATVGQTFQLTGTAPPGAVVELYNFDSLIGTTTADANGNFLFNLMPTQPGEYQLQTATMVNGQRVTSPALTITVQAAGAAESETMTPGAETTQTAESSNAASTPMPEAGTPTTAGANATTTFEANGTPPANATSPAANATPATNAALPGVNLEANSSVVAGSTLTGIAPPNSHVVIFFNDTPVASTDADANGNWQIVLPNNLPPGSYGVRVVVVDEKGNPIVSSSQETSVMIVSKPLLPVTGGAWTKTRGCVRHTAW